MKRTLLLVLALLAVAAGGFRLWRIHGIDSSSHHARASQESLRLLEQEIRRYQGDTGELPEALADLITDNGAPHWSGPYAERTELFDYLGRPVRYEVVDKQQGSFKVSIVSRLGYEEASITSR